VQVTLDGATTIRPLKPCKKCPFTRPLQT